MRKPKPKPKKKLQMQRSPLARRADGPPKRNVLDVGSPACGGGGGIAVAARAVVVVDNAAGLAAAHLGKGRGRQRFERRQRSGTCGLGGREQPIVAQEHRQRHAPGVGPQRALVANVFTDEKQRQKQVLVSRPVGGLSMFLKTQLLHMVALSKKE
jgi:hypothetical protein